MGKHRVEKCLNSGDGDEEGEEEHGDKKNDKE
jgi:hypothetical protein